MCLIVDMNVAHKVLLTNSDPDFKDVRASLFGNQGTIAKLVYGGEFLREYNGNRAVLRRVAVLDTAGRTRKMRDDQVDEEAKNVAGSCVSDDPHIIALARVSGVRLLCSHDHALHKDFTNKALLDNPRGKVYQNAGHKDLLRQFCKTYEAR
jgi:hypothetical protein